MEGPHEPQRQPLPAAEIHLAYLKLAAAAEALPAALDRALSAGETHTEFLEQLLSVEVDATEARRLAGRMRFANFPAPWRLEDFDFSAQPSIDPALIRDLATTRYTADANAKHEHGAAEAHLFIWLSLGERHRFGRAEALHHVERFGLNDLEAVDLQGVDAVWVALDAGPGHAPDCRHLYPIVCHDSDGWHDWRMRRS